jgi:tRNA(Ile)-lysidine synthase TilS/MesJ
MDTKPRVLLVGHDDEPEPLDATTDESLSDVLSRNRIPAASIIATVDGEPVTDAVSLDPGTEYRVRLVEGYDLDSVRDLYDRPDDPSSAAVHTHRHVSFASDGTVGIERTHLTLEELVTHVESVVRETLEEYDLLADDSVLVGLSGEVDSTALLIALQRIADERSDLTVAAATVDDPWRRDADPSVAVEYATELAAELGVELHTVSGTVAERVYGIDGSFADVFDRLSQTEYDEYAAAIGDHLITRLLEHVATREGFETIALGAHASDLVAGLLKSFASGFDVGAFPTRTFGELTYVYPAALLSKRELALYHYGTRGEFVEHALSAEWTMQSNEQTLYRYLADQLLTYWPGIEYWLLEGNARRTHDEPDGEAFASCANCGKTKQAQSLTSTGPPVEGSCRVCEILESLGYLDHGTS